MTTKAGVGTSRHHNPNVAGRDAAEQALENASVSKPDFVFMFASVGYDQHSLLRAVREATGGAPLSADARGKARSTATRRTNRTFRWSSWLFLQTSCAGATG